MLLTEYVKHVRLLLLHLGPELSHLLLLSLHLGMQLLERIRFQVLFVLWVVDEHLRCPELPMTFWICKLDPDADRASFDRPETDIDIASLKCLRLLIMSLHIEHVLREVLCITPAISWLLLLL